MHKYNGKYYFSYSTGDTHYIVYATGNSPYGPFNTPGGCWSRCTAGPRTTPSSSSRDNGGCSIPIRSCRAGTTHLRNMKVVEVKHGPDGSIETIDAYKE